MNIGRRIWEALASIRLAVLTMSALALACGVATVYESRFGTPAAQRVFYQSSWFALLLALLGANVLVSMLERWPWKTAHAGFVMAHVGIVLLLAGSLLSIRFGVDGMLTLAEGESSSAVALPLRTVAVELRSGAIASVEVRHSDEFWGEERHALPNGATLVLTRHQPHVAYHEELKQAPAGSPGLEYHFEGETLGRQAGFLLADDPDHGGAELGPIRISFVKATVERPAQAHLAAASGQARAVFVSDADGSIRYGLSSRKAGTLRGTVAVGTPIATSWMDLKLVVDRVLESAKVDRHLAAALPPEKESQRRPAVEAKLQRGTSAAGPPEWIAWGETRTLGDGAGGVASVSFGDASLALPFRVELLSFRAEKYPGSTMAASYESRVRIHDPERGSFERLVAMNKPLHHRGYTLFQSSYSEGERTLSVLSVSRAPGLPLVYAGTALLVLGIVWMFYVKPWLSKRQGLQALRARQGGAAPLGSLGRALGVLALGVCAALPVAADDPWAALRLVPVQDGGRTKPLDSFARESVKRLAGARAFGGDSLLGLDPVEWLIAAAADPERWRQQPFVRIADAALRRSLELPPDRERFSFAELLAHEPFLRAAERALEEGGDPATRRLYDDVSLLAAILAGEAPAFPARDAYAALVSAHRSGDAAALARAREALPQPPDAASRRRLEREVQYNRVQPFRLAFWLYLAALLALLASFPLRSRTLTACGLLAMLAGFSLHSWGLALRTLVAERAPVTNMYESIVFAAWGAVAFALVLEWRNGTPRVFASCAAGVALPFLLISDGTPLFDAAIDPLAPVLRDNFWLTTHVLTITLGYAALFLALALGHLSLAQLWWGASAASAKTVSNFLHKVMQAGTLLLAAGTLLGGVWASYSWGRFWGWDPKETWALIALLVYLAILHARFAGWIRDLGLAIGSIAGGLAVVMAWYGVNYVLGTGLHSYGLGAGGANAWVLGYACAEAALVVASLWRLAPAAPAAKPLPDAMKGLA